MRREDFDLGGSRLLGIVVFGCVRNCDVLGFSSVRFSVVFSLKFGTVFL